MLKLKQTDKKQCSEKKDHFDCSSNFYINKLLTIIVLDYFSRIINWTSKGEDIG